MISILHKRIWNTQHIQNNNEIYFENENLIKSYEKMKRNMHASGNTAVNHTQCCLR